MIRLAEEIAHKSLYVRSTYLHNLAARHRWSSASSGATVGDRWQGLSTRHAALRPEW